MSISPKTINEAMKRWMRQGRTTATFTLIGEKTGFNASVTIHFN